MEKPKKVLLIDGHSLAYRAFYALPDTLSTSGGQMTNAVYGFASMLLKVLGEVEPDSVIVAFDVPRGELERTERYPQYKAQRKPMPEELRGQISMIEKLLDCMRVPVVRISGHEADDVIGSISTEASGAGSEVVIVTGDRDALQLVSDRVSVLMTTKGISETTSYDPGVVREKYGVAPELLPDIVALKGDSSDNIPGVPGIGEKGAMSLIQEYGSLEGVLDHLDEVSGTKRKKALEENSDTAIMSRDLATIRKDLDLPDELLASQFGDWNRQEVLDFLSSLEFKTLANRFMEMYGAREEIEDATRADIAVRAVDGEDPGQLGDFMENIRRSGVVAVHAETSGTGYCDLELEDIALATSEDVLSVDVTEPGPAGRAVYEVLESEDVQKWFHSAKETVQAASKRGVTVRNISFDTAVASYLENPSIGSYPLWDLCERNLGGRIVLEGEKVEDAPQESLLPEEGEREIKAAVGAARVFHLKGVLEKKLEGTGMLDLFEKVEMPLVMVLEKMEEAGVALDLDVLESLSREAEDALESLREDIFDIVGHSFNIGSPRQLAKVLFEEMDIPPVKRTKTGYSTDSSVLESLRDSYDIAEKIVSYREYAKLKSTYFDVLPKLVCERTGRVHCSFNQRATATGRISSSNPNLQNIPVRTEVGRRIRSAFVPGEPGWKMLLADYSQIELRVLAHMSEDPKLLEAFHRDADIHSETASLVFGVEPGDVTREQRRIAKMVNFGVVYGMGYYGLSSRLGISRDEATSFIDTYFSTYRGVREYQDRIVEEVSRRGFAQTLLGRRRSIPELKSSRRQVRELGERLAVNTPLQGSAADIIKKAMVDVQEALDQRDLKSRMILQIHDELMFEVSVGEAEDMLELVREKMSQACALSVPLKVDIGIYDNWGEAK